MKDEYIMTWEDKLLIGTGVISLPFVFLVIWLLTVSAQVAASDYSREEFPHWADLDHDCLDTREELLIQRGRFLSPADKCKAPIQGHWISAYTQGLITERKMIDIDHVIPLKWAWEHGADKWTIDQRKQFANDPLNLVISDRHSNRQKGQKGPDEWVPYWDCEGYLLRWKLIGEKYEFRNIPTNSCRRTDDAAQK